MFVCLLFMIVFDSINEFICISNLVFPLILLSLLLFFLKSTEHHFKQENSSIQFDIQVSTLSYRSFFLLSIDLNPFCQSFLRWSSSLAYLIAALFDGQYVELVGRSNELVPLVEFFNYILALYLYSCIWINT